MDFEIIAESAVHQGRRLLIGRDGSGYIQLGADGLPIPVPPDDFNRLLAMHHYRTLPTAWYFAHHQAPVNQVSVAD